MISMVGCDVARTGWEMIMECATFHVRMGENKNTYFYLLKKTMEYTQETTISYSLLEIRDRVDGHRIQSDISQCLSL